MNPLRPVPKSVLIAYPILTLLAGSAEAADFESSIERIEARDGQKALVGFAFRRSISTPVRVQVFLDRPRNARGTLIATVEAILLRDDVHASLRSPTPFCGFRWQIPGYLANSGRRIYLYRDRTTELLKSPIAEADGAVVLANTTTPMGALERVTTQGSEQLAIGWAWVPGFPPDSNRVDLYADNPPGAGGIFLGTTTLVGLRPDIAARLGLPDSRLGFAIAVPPRFRCSGRRLYAFAVDPRESGIQLKFGASGGRDPIRIPFDPNLADGFAVSRDLSWSPRIASPRRVRALSQPPWIQQNTIEDESGGNAGSHGFWLASTSLETVQFKQVRPGHGMDALSPADPIFRLTAARTDSGRYALRMKVDKTSGRTIEGIATNPTNLFGGVNDSFDLNPPQGRKPSVGENVFVELDYRVLDRRTWNVAGIDPPRARLTLGVVSRFSRTSGSLATDTYFTELNLNRTSTFDLCPTRGLANPNLNLPPGVPRNGSDPQGMFDSRHCWGSIGVNFSGTGSGELVAYDRNAISNVIRESRTSDGWIRLRIPLTYLIASYAWSRNPEQWDNAEIGGVYLGIEIWGKGVMEVEIRDYRAFSLGHPG